MARFDYRVWQYMRRASLYLSGRTARNTPKLNRRRPEQICLHLALVLRSDYLKSEAAKARWRWQAQRRVFELKEHGRK